MSGTGGNLFSALRCVFQHECRTAGHRCSTTILQNSRSLQHLRPHILKIVITEFTKPGGWRLLLADERNFELTLSLKGKEDYLAVDPEPV